MSEFRPTKAAIEVLAVLEDCGCSNYAEARLTLEMADGLSEVAYGAVSSRRRRPKSVGARLKLSSDQEERFARWALGARTHADGVLVALYCSRELWPERDAQHADIGALSERIGIRVGALHSVGARVIELERRGLVEKLPDGERKKRYRYRLTDEGAVKVEEMVAGL